MTEPRHPGSHPDAELLGAFMEGALPEHERLDCLTHFAECERCREIVFLAQPTQPLKRRWAFPMPVYGGALAAAAAILIVFTVTKQQKMLPTVPVKVVETTPRVAKPTTTAQANPETKVNKKIRPPQLEAKRAATQPATPQSLPAAPPLVPTLAPVPAPPPPRPAAPPPPAPAVKDAVRQISTGNALSGIQGRVRDQSGAAVSGALVTVRPLTGGATPATVKADASGGFSIDGLPRGDYEVQAESLGFQRGSARVEVKPGEVAQVDETLRVGSATQTVEVTAANAMVTTSSANLSSVISPVAALVSTVALRAQSVALDANGQLFYRKGENKAWKKVKAKWQGKAVGLVVVNEGKAFFQITTDAGAVWLSADGLHWHIRAAEKK